MPVDPFASAFVLLRLGDCEAFRQAVNLDDAIDWFESNEPALDEQTARLWSHARRRLPCSGQNTKKVAPVTSSNRLWDVPQRTSLPKLLLGIAN